MTRCCCGQFDDEKSFPYLAFLPVIATLTTALILVLRSRRKEISIGQTEIPFLPPKSIKLPESEPAQPIAKPDDLTLIEGIGVKVAATLSAAGIDLFSQLANTKPEAIKEILTKAGNRISDPTTWPDQARLAAVGKWEELNQFQQTLRGGRKV